MVMFVAPTKPPEVYEDAAMMVTMVGPASESQSASAPDDAPEPDVADADNPPEKPRPAPVKPLPARPSPLEPIVSAPNEPVAVQNTVASQVPPSKPVSQPTKLTSNPPSTSPARAASPAAQPVAQPAAMSNTSRNHTNTYLARVRAYVESHKVYPRGAKRLRQQGAVTISFTIDRNGRLLASRIIRSSGIAAFDQESLAVLERAQPFPKPPKDIVGDRIEITTEIEFALTN